MTQCKCCLLYNAVQKEPRHLYRLALASTVCLLCMAGTPHSPMAVISKIKESRWGELGKIVCRNVGVG